MFAAKARKPRASFSPPARRKNRYALGGGTLAITMKRLPFLARCCAEYLVGSGYSGQRRARRSTQAS